MIKNILENLCIAEKRIESYGAIQNSTQNDVTKYKTAHEVIHLFIVLIIEDSTIIYQHYETSTKENLDDFEKDYLTQLFSKISFLYDHVLTLKNVLHGIDYHDKSILTTLQHNIRTFAELQNYDVTNHKSLPKVNNNLIVTNRLGEHIIASYPSILIWQEEVIKALFMQLTSLFELAEKFILHLKNQNSNN